jgi:hypothetical protein
MMSFFVGNQPQMVSAPPNPLINSYNYNRPTLTPLQAPELFLPKLISSFKKSGKLKPFLPFLKPLPGTSLDKL